MFGTVSSGISEDTRKIGVTSCPRFGLHRPVTDLPIRVLHNFLDSGGYVFNLDRLD